MILGMPLVNTESDNPSQSILRQVEGFASGVFPMCICTQTFTQGSGLCLGLNRNCGAVSVGKRKPKKIEIKIKILKDNEPSISSVSPSSEQMKEV